jgi:hypothetical protein
LAQQQGDWSSHYGLGGGLGEQLDHRLAVRNAEYYCLGPAIE